MFAPVFSRPCHSLQFNAHKFSHKGKITLTGLCLLPTLLDGRVSGTISL